MSALRAGRIAEVWLAIQRGDLATARNLILNTPHITWPAELGPAYDTLMEDPNAVIHPAGADPGQPLAAPVVYRSRPRGRARR